jgi:hypothetical protein
MHNDVYIAYRARHWLLDFCCYASCVWLHRHHVDVLMECSGPDMTGYPTCCLIFERCNELVTLAGQVCHASHKPRHNSICSTATDTTSTAKHSHASNTVRWNAHSFSFGIRIRTKAEQHELQPDR